jgi:membrane protease YdiL (CAAX protease family)
LILSSHALVLVLLILVPLWDFVDARRLRRLGPGQGRDASYVAILLVLWGLTFWVFQQNDSGELLAAPPAFLSPSIAFAVTAGLLALIVAPVVVAAVHEPTREKVVVASSSVAYLLPRTKSETVLFAAVSVTAGICEEIIFRAFLPQYFSTGPFGFAMLAAVGASALMFALAHAGQGWRGMAVAGAAALFFSLMYHATGSLLVPILLHIVVDIRAIAFAAFLRRSFLTTNANAVATSL